MEQISFIISIIIFVALTPTWTLRQEIDHPTFRVSRAHQILDPERTTDFWHSKAQSIIAAKLQQTPQLKTKPVKNIILFLGDGMSVHTVAATRSLMGDCSEQLSFEKFPYFGLSKTYCVDRQVGDSACTATAYLCGVKANSGTIGVDARVPRFDCKRGQDPANHVDSIAKWAQDADKSTGFVTTARVTHASPAGVYAHSADRAWENDAEIESVGCSAKDNIDIARQLVERPTGRRLNVIMGGGRRNFRNTTVNDEEGLPGKRTDGRNLINDWLHDKHMRNASAKYVWSKKGLKGVDLDRTDYLLGLFSSSHCPFHGDLRRKYTENADPSLTEMTEAAIRVLQRNDNGFFLFVEGALIDIAHHQTRARKSLEDTEEFARAVQKAKDMTSEDDTLIVVTSDHSHTMTINGYAFRDQEITGLVENVADDGLRYTILSYANGPGYYNTFSSSQGRSEITSEQLRDADFQYTASVPLNTETHGGDDVGVFATGPFAQYFSGNYEQTNIPAMMAKASNIGPFATA